MTRSPFTRSKTYFVFRVGILLAVLVLLGSIPLNQDVELWLGIALLLAAALAIALVVGELRQALVKFDDKGIVVPLQERLEWEHLVETATDGATLIFVFDLGEERRTVRVPLSQFQAQVSALEALRSLSGEAGALTSENK